jgi:putative endonuclease
MFYTYVAQSIEDSNYQYKGHCENMETRLREHNSGNTKSNKHKAPFKIIYLKKVKQGRKPSEKKNIGKLPQVEDICTKK